ncbi:hypothetical protein [Heyndrickxia ginsengihumi]|uniref:YneQ n=1 Tax=Heyndrickxia ginsengihumi TaxID=363870 RepID=A0A0A6Y1H8_9BACI|nr:hypothetical protein [Heyndrickxia ginsengihumi]KHD86147.1 hypothetical protein NG54_05210 [Heyndrickxia ginsengihumi]MBE6183347.1 hypothetical protein [Bacillus sp. (in: firmicutes)]MCM3024091.1 hypothetical protein [Heyndrickxia ginsengihumi]NEY21068.1 hypothetical protein [Heyndrickxia ginsengihumi]
MAFGISKQQVKEWKNTINRGEIAFLTHFWLDERFPNTKSVTKVGCNDLNRLAEWGEKYQLKKEWIHIRKDGYSHFDLLGDKQREILEKEGRLYDQRKFINMRK